jgi:hypothetical protein
MTYVQPGPQRRPIEGRRVAIGVGIALAAHLLTLLPMFGVFVDSGAAVTGAFLFLIAQVILFVVLLVLGIVRTVKQDGGLGVGLLIGWAVGLIVSFGGCVALLSVAPPT